MKSCAAIPTVSGPRSIGWSHLWLAGSVLLTTIGLLMSTVRGEGTALNSYLFMDLQLPNAVSWRIEFTVAAVACVCAVLGTVSMRWPFFLLPALLALLEALARAHVQGKGYSTWAPLTHSSRYAIPVVLAIMLTLRGRAAQITGEAFLRLVLATVFACHGLEAFGRNPEFVDLIISSGINLAVFRPSQGDSEILLQMIGLLDLVVAGLILVWPARAVLAWAAFWAALAACSRVSANGWWAISAVLVRASYYLGPLALWALIEERKRFSRENDLDGQAYDNRPTCLSD